MKRVILTTLICGSLILGITGCSNSERKLDIGNKSNVKISQNNDVIMSIKDGTLTNTGATLILTNNSDKNFQYGNPYEIEIKKDEVWYKINVELYFTLPALHLLSKESKEIELNWEHGYGKLANGTYRIIKGIDYEKEEGNFETFNVAVEFTIGNKTKEVDNLKETYNKVNEYFGNKKVDCSNLGAYSLDEENNVVIVTLIDNSTEKQEEFIKQTGANFKYIKFEQGGPYYTTSGVDFYIIKPQVHNDIRFNSYYTFDNRTIYLAGNLGEFYIKLQDKDITLKTYLSTTFQTFDNGIKHITDKLELKDTLRDGGTKIYKSKARDITMIVCNTAKNDKDILIGDYSMEYVDGDCEN